MTLPASVLTTKQCRLYRTSWREGKRLYDLRVAVHHDDACGNGHNTFSITADLSEDGRWDAGGCLHELVAQRVPLLAPLIQWHLCSTDGPLHYVANTTYHAADTDWNGRVRKMRDFESARISAIWPDATNAELSLPKAELELALVSRLPALMARFKEAVESLELVY